MAKLVLVSGEEIQEFELGPHNTLGRHPDNTIQILDRIISKEHAQIYVTPDGGYVLKDLGSLNGTYIGNKRVTQQLLHEGDEITLGSTRLVYREQVTDKQNVQRVTIAPGMMESHIRQRIAAEPDAEFRPEKELFDEQALRRDYERLRIAHELGRSISNEFDLDKLLQRILDKAFEILPADRGVIMLMDDAGQPVPRVAKQKKGSPNEEIILSNSIINEVMREKQAVLSSDATIDSRFSGAHSIIMQGIRSTMCVPLLHAGELLGIMNLDSQIATNAFSEKDLRIFTSIANQAAIAIQNARLAHKIEFEARTRAQFQRFFSPGIVQQVIEGKLKLDGVGESREVTVLFADIRGFTAMTEKADAHEIVELLNEYFEVMVEVLFRFEGTLDKYVGDEIMALFGVPVAREDSASLAVECAVEMLRALNEFNRTRGSEHLPPLQVGIGVNTGTCVFGAIGSSKIRQYTVIGDTVNTASRLCSIAKPGEIICSENTIRLVNENVRAVELPKVRVKGKHDELTVYRVIGTRAPAFNPKDVTHPM
jgi:adenylate cyclase